MQVQSPPEELLVVLTSEFGIISNITSLSGVIADGGATRLHFDSGKSAVVKSSPSFRERKFYENYADLIRRCGVGVADLYWSGSDDLGRHWIAIEEIPHPFPQGRWVCDLEQIEMLFRLHFGTWQEKLLTLDGEAYHPVWNDDVQSSVRMVYR